MFYARQGKFHEHPRFLPKDLILFPGDASFASVNEAQGGRTYVLKFTSSDQRLFVSHTISACI